MIQRLRDKSNDPSTAQTHLPPASIHRRHPTPLHPATASIPGILSIEMASYSPFEDYQVGQVLVLNVIPDHGEIRSTSTVRARIRQLHNARTLSCGMVVDLLGEGCHDNPLFLKLYDRRFSEQLRRDHGIDPWTREAEKEYIEAVRTGAARQVSSQSPHHPQV